VELEARDPLEIWFASMKTVDPFGIGGSIAHAGVHGLYSSPSATSSTTSAGARIMA
jgi:hypothetical protein